MQINKSKRRLIERKIKSKFVTKAEKEARKEKVFKSKNN